MDHTLEIETQLHRKYLVHFGPDEISELIARRLIEIQPQVSAPGFRPGRVPLDEVRRQFGGQATQDVLLHHVKEFCDGVLREQGLTLACPPIVTPVFDLPQPGLSAALDMMIRPELEAPDFSQASTKLHRYVLDEESTQRLIDRNFRMVTAPMLHYESAPEGAQAKEGDKLNASVTAVNPDDLPYAPFVGNGDLILGLNTLPDEIEATFIGMQSGEEKEAEIFFDPATTNLSQSAGRTIALKFSVLNLQSPRSASPDEALLKKTGFENEDALKQRIAENTRNILKQKSDERLHADIQQALLERYTLEIPEVFLNERVDEFVRGVIARSGQKVAADTVQELRVQAREPIHRRNVLGLILAAQTRRLQIQVTPEEIDAALRNVRSDLPLGAARDEARGQVTFAKTMEALANEIGVEEKNISQSELIQLESANSVVTERAVA